MNAERSSGLLAFPRCAAAIWGLTAGLLPPFGEAERIHELLAPGEAILEFGCRVGRVTHELRLGHPVTAVDESAEMLAQVGGAEAIRAQIEELDVGRRFACVLLMSNLVNVPDDGQRLSFLQTCARPFTRDGIVVIERQEPRWEPQAGARNECGGVTFALEDVRVMVPHVSATARLRGGRLDVAPPIRGAAARRQGTRRRAREGGAAPLAHPGRAWRVGRVLPPP